MDNQLFYELIRGATRLFAAIMLVKYSVFLFLAPFHRVIEALRNYRIVKVRGKQPYWPLVSVIVPAWNEEVGIISTIKSVLSNDYPSIELVVVNDGSTDGTDKLVKDFIIKNKKILARSRKSIVYISKKNGGKGKALNDGVKKSKGSIIVTVDADSIADRKMITNIVRRFTDDTVDAVVGNVKVAGHITFLSLLQRLEYLFGFYHKRAHSVMGAEYIYGGACAAFRRSTVFDSIGLFDDTSITEDIDMSLRTRYHGLKSAYADDAICYTEGAGSVVGLVKQRTRWKKGRLESFKTYRKMFFSTRKRHNKWLSWFILPLAMLAEIHLLFEPLGLTLLIIYSIITGEFSSLLLGCLFVGMIYVVVGFFTERGRNWWIVPLLPFTWAMFYFLIWVEYIALTKTLIATLKAEGVAWQKWKRKGIGTSVTRGAAR